MTELRVRHATHCATLPLKAYLNNYVMFSITFKMHIQMLLGFLVQIVYIMYCQILDCEKGQSLKSNYDFQLKYGCLFILNAVLTLSSIFCTTW